jgi:hypothetical protein
VADPDWPDTTFIVAEQFLVDVPQPLLIATPELGTSMSLLLLITTTDNAPVPATEKETGDADAPVARDCVPPDVTTIVGCGGWITVTVLVMEAVRLAPSLSMRVI